MVDSAENQLTIYQSIWH